MADISEPPDEMLRALLDAERACPDPPPEIGARVLSRLAAAIDLGNVAGSPPLHVPSPAAAAAAVVPVGAKLITHAALKTCAVFLVGAVAGVGGDHAVRRVAGRYRPTPSVQAPAAQTDRRATPPVEPSPVPPAEAPGPPSPTPVQGPPHAPETGVLPASTPPSPRPTAQRPRAPAERASAAEARDDRLAAERNLLEVARTALARGQSDGALAILRRHANLYPNGDLREEREGLLVQALVNKGDYGPARERAARFHERYPRSLFTPAVDEAIRSIP